MRCFVALVLLLLQAAPASALDVDSISYRPLAPDAWAEAGPRLFLGRFIEAWRNRDLDAYAALLAPDYVFHQSEEGPSPGVWDREDELLSASHLFRGDATRPDRPKAKAITLDPGTILVRPDPEFPCDRGRHALIDLPDVTLLIELENGERIRIRGHHAYWIVKDGEDWKIRRWDEEPSPEALAPRACNAAVAAALPNRLWTVAPNPSRVGAGAVLTFAVERDGDAVEVAIYNVAGRRVAQLAHGPSASGARTITWDGRDEQGSPIPSGMYFLRAQIGGRDWRERIVRL